MSRIATIPLGPNSIPRLGFGTGTVFFKQGGASTDDPNFDPNTTPFSAEASAGVLAALNRGFWHIDTAEMYGTEKETGAALAEFLKANPSITREQLFITSKVYANIFDVKKALRGSLERLGTPYVDLYLIHAPFKTTPEQMEQVWRGMEALVESGLTRQIGVSNFRVSDLQHLDAIARIKPVVNQVEAHPYLQQLELRRTCKELGIQMEAYGPLMPLTKRTGGPVDEVVARVAGELNATPAQVLLAWSLAEGYVPITITRNPERLDEYMEAVKEGSRVVLSTEQVEAVRAAGASAPFRAFWPKEYESVDA